jgi:hypothetical protein
MGGEKELGYSCLGLGILGPGFSWVVCMWGDTW